MRKRQNSASLILHARFPSSTRSRETGRSTRWRWRRRRGKSRQPSSVASVPAAPLMPSLIPAATPTSSRLGGAFGGAHQPVVHPRKASGRFQRGRPRTSKERKTEQNFSQRRRKYLGKCKEHLVYLRFYLWSRSWNGQHQKLCRVTTAWSQFKLAISFGGFERFRR